MRNRKSFNIVTVRNRSCGKVMFSQASVILSRGGMCGRGCMHARGHAWQGGGMYGRVCVVGGVCGRGPGVCVAGGGVYGRRDDHCSARYASYCNAFLLWKWKRIIIYISSDLLGKNLWNLVTKLKARTLVKIYPFYLSTLMTTSPLALDIKMLIHNILISQR